MHTCSSAECGNKALSHAACSSVENADDFKFYTHNKLYIVL